MSTGRRTPRDGMSVEVKGEDGEVIMISNDEDRAVHLEQVVLRRLEVMRYLYRVHEGGDKGGEGASAPVHWMNLVWMTRTDIAEYYAGDPDRTNERAQKWFSFGFSLSELLGLASGPKFVAALNLLMEEWEYHYAGALGKGLKAISRTRRALVTPLLAGVDGKEGSAVHHHGGGPVHTFLGSYELLRMPPMPRGLDYREVVLSLMQLSQMVYSKFLEPSCSAHAEYDGIIKWDGRFKHHFLSPVSRELNELATEQIKHQTSSVPSLFQFLEGYVSRPGSKAPPVPKSPSSPSVPPPPTDNTAGPSGGSGGPKSMSPPASPRSLGKKSITS